MTDYPVEVKKFINQKFVPGTTDDYEFHYNNQELLSLLRTVFPVNSIEDFELSDILTELGYERHILTSNNLVLDFISKLKKQIGEDYLENFDLLEDADQLEDKVTLQTNYFCWLFKRK